MKFSTFVMVWSVRLGGFLLFRILKTGKDGRFDEMRVRPAACLPSSETAKCPMAPHGEAA